MYTLYGKEVAKERIPNYDPTSEKCMNTVNFLISIPILTIFNIIPVMLLILYSFKCVKNCLSKCKLDLTVVVYQFHCCYNDCSDGGKDLRVLSSLYFVLRYVSTFLHYFVFNRQKISFWSYPGFLFMITAVVIGYLKPYKKRHMNVLDTIVLTYMTIFCHLLARDYFASEEISSLQF